MANTLITPVILAGGTGTRLWPLSRKSYPKQFTRIVGNETLFQKTALRVLSSSTVTFKNPITVTNDAFRFIVSQQLQSVGVEPGAIIIEPTSKNTAAAVAAATLFVATDDPESIVLVVSADHVIPNTPTFHDAVANALPFVKEGKIATFGVIPTRPETGYGYLELQENPNGNPASVKNFIEKPNLDVATEMLNDGRYLWNAGIFMFKGRNFTYKRKSRPRILEA